MMKTTFTLSLISLGLLLGSCGSDNSNDGNETSEDLDAQIQPRVVLEQTYYDGEAPLIRSFHVNPDSGCEDCKEAKSLEIDMGGAIASFVWSNDGERVDEEFIDSIIRKEETRYQIITASGTDFNFFYSFGTRWILECEESLLIYYLDVDNKGHLTDEERKVKLSFLDKYPDLINDRQDMKDILVEMGLASEKPEDPTFQIRDIQYEPENDEFYYDPCLDGSGWSFFQLSGDAEYLNIYEKDQPSFTYSYQDSYGSILDSFEKIDDGIKFMIRGNGETDAWRGLVLTSYGFWAYRIMDEGQESFSTTQKVVETLERVEYDCEEEEY